MFKSIKECEYDECHKRASFNIYGSKPRYCGTHKTAEMMDVVNKRCEANDCNIICPNFDIIGGKGRFCVLHKTIGMIDVRSKNCEYDNCTKRANFDIKGGKGQFCKEHKTTEMIDVRNKHCENSGCHKQPAFDIIGGKGRFCKEHKTVLMIDVKSKHCEYEGCIKLPSFDITGGKGSFCVSHKTSEMIDVKSKLCENIGCTTRATYNIKGKQSKFCKVHKSAEMIDVINKRCEVDGCNKLNPNFDYKDGKGRFCKEHKKDNMIDVKHLKCEVDDCETRSRYGLLGHSPSHCAKHRQIGMLYKPNVKCSECKDLAIWGINWIPRHCETHKTLDDENLIERPCISCGLSFILDKDNRCEYCNPESFKKSFLAKQNAIIEYLNVRGLNGDSTDRVIDGGACGRERPDRIYDFGDKILIFECDENQHKSRACECEQIRMVNISQSFGGLPVYFIRWNPDDYRPAGSKKMEDIKKRYKLVGNLIENIKANRITLPNTFVSAIYLYYDNWSSLAEEKWQTITPLIKNEVIYPI